MAIQTTYTHARANLAALCDEVTANREVVIIHRRGAEDVALIAAEETQWTAGDSASLAVPQKRRTALDGTGPCPTSHTLPAVS